MQTFPECYGCLIRLAVTSMNSAQADQNTQIQTIKEILHQLEKADSSLSPSELAGDTNKIIRENVGVEDLYQEMKRKSHKMAEVYREDLKELLKQGEDTLEQGLKISAAGNIIDVVYVNDYDLWHEVEVTVNQKLQGGGLANFRKRLNDAAFLLYLADNVGEIVFDRVFIESLGVPVIYAVKGGPILNDATLEDALKAGIDQAAKIVETGSRSPGTVLNQCTEEFQQLFEESTLVLAKGQANYETLDDLGDKVFFLMRVKCPIISREIKSPLGNLILKQGKPLG